MYDFQKGQHVAYKNNEECIRKNAHILHIKPNTVPTFIRKSDIFEKRREKVLKSYCLDDKKKVPTNLGRAMEALERLKINTGVSLL